MKITRRKLSISRLETRISKRCALKHQNTETGCEDMEMQKIKWDESMAERCIARHNRFLPRVWRSAGTDRGKASGGAEHNAVQFWTNQDEASAGSESDEDDDSCWTEFSEKIKRLAAKS